MKKTKKKRAKKERISDEKQGRETYCVEKERENYISLDLSPTDHSVDI